MASGEPVLCLLGSDPRGRNGQRAVRWARLCSLEWDGGDPPHDQASLDKWREKALLALPTRELWRLLQAGWYGQLWNHNAAPADLADPVLSGVWLERMSGMPPEQLAKEDAKRRLETCAFGPTAGCSLPRMLDTCSVQQLTSLGAPLSEWMTGASKVHRQRLMEWLLLSERGHVPAHWQNWFRATDLHERWVAELLLEQDLPRNDFTRHWVRALFTQGWLSQKHIERWVGSSEIEAFAMHDILPDPIRRNLWSGWKQDGSRLQAALASGPWSAHDLLRHVALSVDLESDGETVWELGQACAGQKQLLFSPLTGGDLDTALQQFAANARAAPFAVGQNLLAWDWPILSRRVDLPRPFLLWDTLLVQYLLEPQSTSHALQSSHRADDDALQALKRFEQQLGRLPSSFAEKLLIGAFKDSTELLEAVALTATLAYERPAPAWFAPLAAGALVVLPTHRLCELDWVQGVQVISANPAEHIPFNFLQVDAKRLEQAVRDAPAIQPAALVLCATAHAAEAQGIALRFGMIPPWLLESSATLNEAVRQACFEPERPDCGTHRSSVALLPVDVQPLVDAGASTCRFVGFDDKVLVEDFRRTALVQLVQRARAAPTAALVRVLEAEFEPRWLLADVPARKLKVGGGWRALQTVTIPDAMRVGINTLPVSRARPQLATRRNMVLHPGTSDQAVYWREVLRTVHELAGHRPGAVPILLVGSSRSMELVELLRLGLAAIGLGEPKPETRSRQEHLRRAARRNFLLVDLVDQFPDWVALAGDIGVALLPVVEALPVEQWYATFDATVSQSDDNGQQPDDASPLAITDENFEGSDDEDEASAADEVEDAYELKLPSDSAAPIAACPVSAVALMERLPALITQFLSVWLDESGLRLSDHPAVIIDSRAAQLGKELTSSVDLLPLAESSAPPTGWAEQLDAVFDSLQLVREEPPSDLKGMEQFLKTNWNSPGTGRPTEVLGFKSSQRLPMQVICSRQSDVLVALPTGEGKSLLFQVPALCRGLRNKRLTLVLSPLKALMRDQVEGLRRIGFSESADYLSGDRPPNEIADVLQGVLDHRIVLLYVAPERLRSPLFMHVLRQRVDSDEGLEYVVVDETHCVNQWGHEFRPDYFFALNLLLHEFRTGAGNAGTPFVLLSATVTAFDRQQLGKLMTAATVPSQRLMPFVSQPEAFEQPLRSHIEVVPSRAPGRIADRRSFDQVLEGRLPAITRAIEQATENISRTGQRSAVIVFVTQRDHAEALARRLATDWGNQVEYFHAGLDAMSREDIYQRFQKGDVNVLVATKAFGMGMDIPDIHFAVHLGPPNYLEDYLQEVGRIGRDEKLRKRAQLSSLKALLLFSAEDFEGIRSQRAKGALQLAFIKEQYEAICKQAQPVDGQWMAIVPQEGFRPPVRAAQRRVAATRLRMTLYWLERAGAVGLKGAVPNLLKVTLQWGVLQRIAAEAGDMGKLAVAILGAEAPRKAPAAPTGGASAPHMDSNWLGSVFDRIADMVGFLVGSSRPATGGGNVDSAAVPAASDKCDAVINLSQVMFRCSFSTLGDVMAGLIDLAQRGALTVNRDLAFALRALASEDPPQVGALFSEVERANERLMRLLGGLGTIRFALDELQGDGQVLASDPDKVNLYRNAFERGAITLARASGVRVRQVVELDQQVRYEAILPAPARRMVEVRMRATLLLAKNLLVALKMSARGHNGEIALKDLILKTRDASPSGRFREADLRRALTLLSAMSLASVASELVPMSHLLMLDQLDRPLDTRELRPVWADLEKVNRVSELRNDAMEIFANLPPDAQSSFIEGYFAQSDAAGLQRFLISELGEIEELGDAALSTFIREKREHLRATEVKKFFRRYRQSEEPSQWQAISHPYDRHLLVNAGPGSGKTSVLVARVVHLIREQGIAPGDIIVLAFNRAVVFEIKKRIRELFRTLGYASYVKGVRVSTFHALAMRSLASSTNQPVRSARQKDLLQEFAQRLAEDAGFRQRVAGTCRTVLVDEFQDASDNIYQVIHQLHLGTERRAGVMVIGDDDQDILRWNRPGREFSEVYFDRFTKDFGRDRLQTLSLRVNFRSGTEIVDRSQSMLSGYFDAAKPSRRLKEFQLRARASNPPAGCERVQQDANSLQAAIAHVRQCLRVESKNADRSLAILCRSNAEVLQVHGELAPTLPHVALHGDFSHQLSELRHVGLWLDDLALEIKAGDRALTDQLKRDLLGPIHRHTAIPEVLRPQPRDIRLEDLWDLCVAEQSHPHLSDLVRLTKELRLDELGRMLGHGRSAPQAIVSTIHRVKGLEFDTVFVMPSEARFPMGAAGPSDLAMDAAEEARLLYVAMTRAKHQMTYFVGPREQAWARRTPLHFAGKSLGGKVLTGSMDEVGLGWSMTGNCFNPRPDACQAYIEQEVAVGDHLVLGGAGGGAGKSLMHVRPDGRQRQVGFLANSVGAGSPKSALRVSAVVRFDPRVVADGQTAGQYASAVLARGWGYVVLVSGRLS